MNHQHPNRRELLLGGLGCAAGVTLWPGQASAIDPITRDGRPKFKFSLAAYSYRKLLGGKQPTMDLVGFIRDCAAMGLEGTELTSYYFPSPVTDSYLATLKQHAFRLGLDVSGTAVGNDFCHPSGAKRDQQIAHVKRWIEYAQKLSAPVIRIFAGSVKAGQSDEDAFKLCVAGIEECCHYAGEHGVFLALENHGGVTATPAQMLKIVEAVRSPWFGVNLDTGNFHTADVYGDLAKLAPYALNVQVKVVIKPADGKSQPTDFARLADMLREVAYRGYIVLEYEEAEDPRKACPRFVDELRKAFSS